MRTNNTLIQTFTTDNANALVNVTRNNDLLTVAGSLNMRPTNLTINAQAATIYNDLTYAVTNGVNITDGINKLLVVANGTMTNSMTNYLPVAVTLRSDLNGNLVWDGIHAFDFDCANQMVRVTVTNILKRNLCMTALAGGASAKSMPGKPINGRRQVKLITFTTGCW